MPTRFTPEERFEYLKQFGSHCLAYSTLQPGMEYFDVPGVGYLAYMTHSKRRFVLGEPICAESERGFLIQEALRDHRMTTFVQLHIETARFLHEHCQYRATQMGIETQMWLADWDVKGPRKQQLRNATNQARRLGVGVAEVSACDSIQLEIEAVSQRWLRTRRVSDRQMAFLVRPITPPASSEERWWVARLEDKIAGFALFDPIYRRGDVVGYHPNISRASKLVHRGIFYVLMLHAAEAFRLEGRLTLNLGLSPLSRRVIKPVHRNLPGDWLLSVTRRLGQGLYNFGGIEFAKSRFCGDEVPVYCAHQSWLPVAELISIFRLSHVI